MRKRNAKCVHVSSRVRFPAQISVPESGRDFGPAAPGHVEPKPTANGPDPANNQPNNRLRANTKGKPDPGRSDQVCQTKLKRFAADPHRKCKHMCIFEQKGRPFSGPLSIGRPHTRAPNEVQKTAPFLETAGCFGCHCWPHLGSQLPAGTCKMQTPTDSLQQP